MHIKLIVTTVLAFTIWSGCSSKRIIGRYAQNPKSKSAFAGKELMLNEDGTFTINEWTDNYGISINENEEIECLDLKGKGFGKFVVNGDSLMLLFNNVDYATCLAKIQSKDDKYQIELSLVDEIQNPNIGATVIVLDEENKTIKGSIINENGNTEIFVDKEESPYWIQVDGFAMEPLKFRVSDNMGDSQHYIKSCRGYFEQGEALHMKIKVARRYIEYFKDGRKTRLWRLK